MKALFDTTTGDLILTYATRARHGQYIRDLTSAEADAIRNDSLSTKKWVDVDGVLTQVDKPVVVPESVTRIQMRDTLIDADLFDTVDIVIAAMPDSTDEEAKDKKKMAEWWNNAPTFRRDNPRIALMAAAMGLNDTQVDDLFIAAGNVV